MTNRRNFVKQAGAMIAMATMPGGNTVGFRET